MVKLQIKSILWVLCAAFCCAAATHAQQRGGKVFSDDLADYVLEASADKAVALQAHGRIPKKEILKDLRTQLRMDVSSRKFCPGSSSRARIRLKRSWNPSGKVTTQFADGTSEDSQIEGFFLHGTLKLENCRSRKRRSKARKKGKKRSSKTMNVAVSVTPKARDGEYNYSFAFAHRRKMFNVSGALNVYGNSPKKVRVTRTSVAKVFADNGCAMEAHDHMDFDEHIALHAKEQSFAEGAVSAQSGGPLKIVELGIVALTDYTDKHGANTEARITTIVNTSAVWYQSLNIAFDIKQLIAYVGGDPFSSTTYYVGLLNNFRYNHPFGNTTDLNHLFTARSFTNSDGSSSGVIGVAWLNAMCGAYRFGLSRDYGPENADYDARRAILFAHEIGHNAGAYHDGSSCYYGNYIMIPCLSNSGQTQWSSQSVSQITNHTNGASCLFETSDPPDNPYTVSGRIQDEKGAGVGGAKVSITVRGVTYTAITDSDGNYTLENVIGPDQYSMTIEKAGYNFITYNGYLGNNMNLNINATRNVYELDIRVIDQDGNPVAAGAASAGGVIDDRNWAASTDASGRIRLIARHGDNYELTLAGQGCFFTHGTVSGKAFGIHERLAVCQLS